MFLAIISRTPQLENALKQAAVPIVFLELANRGDSLGPQDMHGGRVATKQLLALGHRRTSYRAARCCLSAATTAR